MNAAGAARCVLLLAACAVAACDDSKQPVTVGDRPLQRIVTLSPHLAELVYSAGAGDSLVGVSAWSDYPAAVKALPQVGDAFGVDLEQLLLLAPDAILAWKSGTPTRTVDELRSLGYRVEVIETRRLADVASALRRIGRLAGSGAADDVADAYLADVNELRERYAEREPIRVFYQVSSRPLYTVNADHFASELIELCGGVNVFADLGDLAPLVSEEAVLQRDPELIVAGGAADDDGSAFSDWRHWSDLAASSLDNFFTIDANLLARPTTRLVEAGEAICHRLDEGRARRNARGAA